MQFSQTPSDSSLLRQEPLLKRLTAIDWLFSLALVLGAGYGLFHYGAYTNYYDKLVLVAAVPVFSVLGWRWKPVRLLMVLIAALSLGAIRLYHGDLAQANQSFFLKYLLSSQSAIL